MGLGSEWGGGALRTMEVAFRQGWLQGGGALKGRGERKQRVHQHMAT